ncbi:maturation protein [ssRNA phage Gephyllon.4_21]|uniref:Maturation protein n=2 Tax=Fiersviridae TaxID=2842319 RepID=A0A8S5KX93_9VIRU|nr:maturation protein [ssRNA phage Gephyllon.4_21]QDH86780.1 MAG: hypothetical protein H4BulkLitter24450_000001 [Leviviridae sp.]DAD50014.1 TPA_asm: maturation protein [ssRNA phage Gephyllon.4_21]
MAKHPDWSLKDPSFTNQRYWTAQPVQSNPQAGYWTSSSSSDPNFVWSRGLRSYTVTPGFNSPNRVTLVKPLVYTATYEVTTARYFQRQHATRIFNVIPGGGGDPYPVNYLYQDSTTETHNVFSLGFRIGEYDASSALDRANNKLLDSLKDQKVNVAQAFAEREMTVKTVTDTVSTIAKTFVQLKKGNFTGAAKALGIKPPKRGQRRFNKEFVNDAANAVGNGWLALQYGWRPLLQDVYGSAQTLAQASLASDNRNSIYAVATGLSRKNLALNQMKSDSVAGWSGSSRTLWTCDGFYLVKVKVRYVKSSPPLSALSKVGITNPALLAWELMPYSFVIDWFVPIGNWLGNLDATAGLSFDSGFRTTFLKYEATSIYEQSISRNGDFDDTSQTNAQEAKKFVQMSRQTLGSFPAAPAPRFKNPLSMSHMASALALLKQFKR